MQGLFLPCMSVEVTQLSRQYGSQKAVDSISFRVAPGEIVGFLGPNGAGKSTTMKMITGYLTPTAGSIKVCEQPVLPGKVNTHRHIGYLPEHNALYPELYVKEYLLFMAGIHQLGKGSAQRVNDLIDQVGLGPERHKKIGQLSKGYKQRVGLAQALLHDPEVLILDEPTSGLDPNQIIDIRQLIAQTGAQKTIVLSTHIMQEVQALCSRAIIINKGQLVADAPIDQLTRAVSDQVAMVIELEGNEPLKHIETIAGFIRQEKLSGNKYRIIASRDMRSQLFKLAEEGGQVLLSLQLEERKLEAVFKELTQNEGGQSL